MAGQLIQRGDKWLVRVFLGRDPDTGKRTYHNKTIAGTKKDAQRYLTKKLRELDTGAFVETSDQPLGEYLTKWLDASAKPRLRPRTYADYESLLSRYIRPALAHRPLSRLTPLEIQKVYAGMQDEGLSARTVRYAHSVLHSALEQAVKWNLLARNPAALVDLPRQDRNEMTALSPAQASAFLAEAKNDRWNALWVLLVTSGLRPGEALGLRWADLDGEKLRVQRNLVRQEKKGWNLMEPKTDRSRRTVVLPPETVRVLQNHRRHQATERLKAGDKYENHGLVFATQTGQPLEHRIIARRHFHKIVAAAKLPPIRPYDLRHTHATLLLAAGVNPKIVSERLGHSSIGQTLDTYSHVLPDMQQESAERLQALLFGT